MLLAKNLPFYRQNGAKCLGDKGSIKAVFTVIKTACSMKVQLARHLESPVGEQKNHLLHQGHLTHFDSHCLHSAAIKLKSHVNQEVIKNPFSAW